MLIGGVNLKVFSQKHYAIILYNFILSILISISSIFIFTYLFLKSKFIYGIYLTKVDFSNCISLSKNKIYENYCILCDFISSPFKNKLVLPDFNISYNSMIHFYDVKKILTTLLLITLLTLCIIIIQFIIKSLAKAKFSLHFLMYVPIELILFCSTLVLSFYINFDKCFLLFHKLLFNNDYWLFDPKIDPIINILPEDFFLMAASIILSSLIIESIFIIFIRKHILKTHSIHIIRFLFLI